MQLSLEYSVFFVPLPNHLLLAILHEMKKSLNIAELFLN